MERRVTTCDICNINSSLHPTEGWGVYEGAIKSAKELGWKAFRDGSGIERHICLQCQEEGKSNG